uniref:Uncharacterized protein LOC111099912 n=1 Tax=Crassostrea virginica TaxID=6565 RepID=A0A8B8AB48_CRAVI|nr:uncharacterized protein LOC111099912 [Crassostrea virginica]
MDKVFKRTPRQIGSYPIIHQGRRFLRVKRQVAVSNINVVRVCPKTEEEIEKARKRMKCGNDLYGRNRYMCLPDKKLKSLKEFCFNDVMGLQEKGHCLVIADGTNVVSAGCKDFSSGCPETFYHYDEVHKYNACQRINIQNGCYLERPICRQKDIKSATDMVDIVTVSRCPESLDEVRVAILRKGCGNDQNGRNR